MQNVIGVLMIIGGIVCGLYAGIWWAFVGGIVDIINEVKAQEIEAINVAIGIAKVLFAGAIGQLSAVFLIIPGLAILKS